MDNAERINLVTKTASLALEERKALDVCLRAKESEVRSSENPVMSGELDPSIWNDLGIYFLNNRMEAEAVIVYSHMLSIAQSLEGKHGHIHKGLPLYNIGVAQINLRNFDEGIPNILKAHEEDKLRLGEEKAKQELAHRLKEGLIDFTSRIVDNNYLQDFNNASNLSIQRSYDLTQNMEDAEKLFFAKILNSKKLVSFHDDSHTKVVMFDNLKNLCLVLESNLRRRGRTKVMLAELVVKVFSTEGWKTHFDTQQAKALVRYSSVGDFDSKLDQIEGFTPTGNGVDDFHLRNFLTTTLVRNFTAHYLDENIALLSHDAKYERTFARILWSLLYTLQYRITPLLG